MTKVEKLYTYQEMLDMHQGKNRYIQSLQERLEQYHNIVERYKKSKEMIDPQELLEMFAIIDMENRII